MRLNYGTEDCSGAWSTAEKRAGGRLMGYGIVVKEANLSWKRMGEYPASYDDKEAFIQHILRENLVRVLEGIKPIV